MIAVLALYFAMTMAEPPNLPCIVGDKFIYNGETWDCGWQGTELMPGEHRWVKHASIGAIHIAQPFDGMAEWIESHCRIVMVATGYATSDAVIKCSPDKVETRRK